MQANVQKYDETVINLIKENMALEEEYKRVKKMHDQFQLDYEEKEAEYNKYVKEKQDIEEMERQERIRLFVQNHAARIIQRYWRKYMEKTRAARQSKKSKSKGKGKMKAKSKE